MCGRHRYYGFDCSQLRVGSRATESLSRVRCGAMGCEQGLNDSNAWKREDRARIRLTLDRRVGGSREWAKQCSETMSKVRKMKAL